MLYLYVETPLHAGTGSGLSAVDLPIQRERITQYPMIQGSGVKGKLRAAATLAAATLALESKKPDWTKEEISAVFGPEKDGAEHAGALIAGDARLLLFPVRSLMGIFAYVTSCDVLSRFVRDLSRGQQDIPWSIPSAGVANEQKALVTQESRVAPDGALVLEEFSFDAERDENVQLIADWIADNAFPREEKSGNSGQDLYTYWREKLRHSLVILPDNDFRDFVVNATEIITRVRIDPETRTVAKGMLWTEEHLPNDTLLYVPIYATHARKRRESQRKDADGLSLSEPFMRAEDVLAKAQTIGKHQHYYLQLGGDETVGRGMVRMHWGKNHAQEGR